MNFACIGSDIETEFSDGRIVIAHISNSEMCAVANELIMTGRWKLSPTKRRTKL